MNISIQSDVSIKGRFEHRSFTFLLRETDASLPLCERGRGGPLMPPAHARIHFHHPPVMINPPSGRLQGQEMACSLNICEGKTACLLCAGLSGAMRCLHARRDLTHRGIQRSVLRHCAWQCLQREAGQINKRLSVFVLKNTTKLSAEGNIAPLPLEPISCSVILLCNS